jgi:hypothetical protein
MDEEQWESMFNAEVCGVGGCAEKSTPPAIFANPQSLD